VPGHGARSSTLPPINLHGDQIADHKHMLCSGQKSSQSNEAATRFRPRALITEADAIQIYLSRPGRNAAQVSNRIEAMMFWVRKLGVSPKAIRDIWNRRTWAPETQHLWTEGEFAMIRAKSKKIRNGVGQCKGHCKSQSSAHSSGSPAASYDPYSWTNTQNMSSILNSFGMQSWHSSSSQKYSDHLRPCTSRPASIELEPTEAVIPAALLDRREARDFLLSINSIPSDSSSVTYGSVDVMENLGADDPFHADWPYW
jgi:hypothetical protein